MEKWAIITAASQGIGYMSAEALATLGYNLIIGSRNLDKIRLASNQLKKKHGIKAVGIQLDLTDKKSINEFLSKAGEEITGDLKVAILNYGNPSCEPCRLFDTKWEDWIEAVKLYLASTSLILSWLRKYKPVRTIIISSFTTRNPHPPLALADTVRKGLEVIVKVVAREEPELYPVLLLLGSFKTPGAVKTISKIAESEGMSFEEFWRERVEKLSPLGRTGDEGELASIIKMLAEAPKYLLGTSIVFDGASSNCI